MIARPPRAIIALVLLSCGSGTKQASSEPPKLPIQASPKAASFTAMVREAEAPGATTPSSGQKASLAPLVQQVRSSVVGVTIRRQSAESKEMRDFWRRFFGPEGSPEKAPHAQTGIGSGVIIDAKGLVLTNNHVVSGAEEVLVKTADEVEHRARVKGTDPATDIAVLQIQDVKGRLPVATLGSSDAIRVGDYVMAIGSPFGLDLTVTSGIISAKARVIGAGPYDEFLQTDAAINPGNSGGPLFDLDGKVVGINTAIVASGQGIGFSVPIDLVKSILPQLETKGKVVRGYLGITVQDLTPDLARALGANVQQGALISSLEEGGPAAKASLKPGDVVLKINDKRITGAAELSREVAQLAPGQRATVEYERNKSVATAQVVLGERPSAPSKAAPRPQEENESLGLGLESLPKEIQQKLGVEKGVYVEDVDESSRAARAGLKPGDVIVEANGKAVSSPKELMALAKARAKEPLALRVVRDSGAIFVVVPASEQ
jgi:serine protease Do